MKVSAFKVYMANRAAPCGFSDGRVHACQSGRLSLWERLGKRLEAEHIPEIGFTVPGCRGFAAPEQSW